MKYIKTFEDLTRYSAIPLAYDVSAELDEIENQNSENLPFDEYVKYMDELKKLVKSSLHDNFYFNTNKISEYIKKYPFIPKEEPYKKIYWELFKVWKNKHDELNS